MVDYRLLKERAVGFMLSRGWKEKAAKRRGFEQSLFDHTLVELDALITLLPILRRTFVPPLTEDEERALLASVLAHDVGKELPEWQAYVTGRGSYVSDVNRRLTEEVAHQVGELFGVPGTAEMVSAVLLHMRHERTPANVAHRLLFGGHSNERWMTMASLVDAVDNVCSARGLFAAIQCLETRTCLAPHVRVAYHLVQLRGVSTTLLHRATIDSFLEHGWSPLLHYSNGTVYVAGAAEPAEEPTREEIRSRLAQGIAAAFPADIASLVVGHPLRSIMPKPDLFDHTELAACLRVAARLVRRGSFAKKREAERRKVIASYRRMKGDETPLSAEILARETQRIDAAQPEMCVFKFFKAAISEELLGSQVSPEAERAYSTAGGGGKGRKEDRVTPETVARLEYDRVFGTGAFDALLGTSTLMPARDMSNTVDRFWALHGASFGLAVDRIEHLLEHSKREDTLINTLVSIAERVYTAVPEARRPKRATPEQMAECFLIDLVHPAAVHAPSVLAEHQLRAYKVAKANARKPEATHICPICNATFDRGSEARADYLANPDSHTNRAVAHGKPGYIVICDACRFERFLQQMVLGSRVSETLVLFPRMNIGHGNGEVLRQKALRIRDDVAVLMTEVNPNPDERISLGMTTNMARKLSRLIGTDAFRLSPGEIVDLMTYVSGRETKKRHRKDLEDKLKELYDVEELTVGVLNDNWGTSFATKEEALEALVRGDVADGDARIVRAEAFRLTPQVHLVCETPHMILIPLANPVSLGDESDVNIAIRQLYVTLILGLALDCSAAILGEGELITFEGGEGVARVPPVSALRELIGTEWISIDRARVWVDAIGAAALLAGDTEFPERSNLFAILKCPTAGHILRRIEQASVGRQPHAGHIRLLEIVRGVLR